MKIDWKCIETDGYPPIGKNAIILYKFVDFYGKVEYFIIQVYWDGKKWCRIIESSDRDCDTSIHNKDVVAWADFYELSLPRWAELGPIDERFL